MTYKYKRKEIKGSLQQHVYTFLCSCIPNPWPNMLAVRYRTLCPVGPPLDTQWLNAPEFAQSSKKLGIGKFMMVIKTWANSWSTSDCYHEETRLPCIMGCQCFVSCEDGAKDVLAHYLECPILWTVIHSAALTLQRPQEGSAECRACLCNPTLNDFKR